MTEPDFAYIARHFAKMDMKKGILAAVTVLLLLAATSASAQFYLGPALQVGMTYSKNLVIEDTSIYHISNSPSLFGAVGFDAAYQFDKNIRVQLGVQGQYRSFNLVAPDTVQGLTFTNIKQNTMLVSLPMTINYRIPLGKSENKFFNVMAGHGFDFMLKDDSTVQNSQQEPVDSGGSFARHEYQFLKGGFPVSSVLLGVGADLVSARGNILNISLVWGISTRQIFRGSIREWSILHQDYNPTTTSTDPEEFPDHYYEWGLRGSNLSLRASYYFSLGKKGDKEEKGKSDNGDVEKAEKPAKEKAEKPEKAPKEKKAKGDVDD